MSGNTMVLRHCSREDAIVFLKNDANRTLPPGTSYQILDWSTPSEGWPGSLAWSDTPLVGPVIEDCVSSQAKELVRQCDGLTKAIRKIENGLLHH